jgi:acetyl/propionyl-CoA carboxylase alpha subunit
VEELIVHHAFKLGETDHALELSRGTSGYRLHLGGRALTIALRIDADGCSRVIVDGIAHDVVIATRGDDIFIHLDGEIYQLRYEHPLQRLAAIAQGKGEDRIRAPMPGSLIALNVAAGDTVTRGQTLLIMESMKMETSIVAPRDGVIEAVYFSAGQTFDRDALLVEFKNVD